MIKHQKVQPYYNFYSSGSLHSLEAFEGYTRQVLYHSHSFSRYHWTPHIGVHWSTSFSIL